MDEQTIARLRLLTEAGKSRGHVYYDEIAELFPEEGGIEFDELLSALEKARVEMLVAPKMLLDRPTLELLNPKPVHKSDERSDHPLPVSLDEPLLIYLREIANVPPLTTESEIQVAKCIGAGGDDADTAKTQLVEAHLSLVIDIATQYICPGIHILDLIQQGNSGLINAAGQFDCSRGYTFSTYATFWIHRALNRLFSRSPEDAIARNHRR